MNIQQLRYVVATAEHGSMTAAAAALFVAQPALSRAVRLLERELGVTLFARAGRGIALTPEGEAFIARARKVLRSLDALRGIGEREARDAQLVIAASPTLQAVHGDPDPARAARPGVRRATPGCSAAAARPRCTSWSRSGSGRRRAAATRTIPTELAVVPLGQAEVRLSRRRASTCPTRSRSADLAGVPLVLPTVGTDRRVALDGSSRRSGSRRPWPIESDERSVWLEAVLRGLASCVWHSVDALRIAPAGVVARAASTRRSTRS